MVLHPNGLNISIKRNNAKPNNAKNQVFPPEEATDKGIHVPTNSSILTAQVSLPQYFSITPNVHIPIIVTLMISPQVAH